ncbi:hypothetical protein TRL7639_03434 [Falsiruegeria litorea R37]|uniref:Flagellar protein n=1 Tax=Falsiruegeria litorea R37 TaxID=1200284 RepID=A0A1Y5TGX4_9RHOB|nr:DUF1217 domain-containing protein [Falsiruegeria litorea]SLN61742.1 hypothetical protein TRL7639_03434 [Falsiruegeria litorea R37]
MSFSPVVPTSGIVGWKFLQRTYDSQLENFSKSQMRSREHQYFLDNIGEIKSAEELVNNRRLLSVALGAFGLQDDIDSKFFVQKILQDGTKSDDALSNRLADARYQKFSEAFGFGPGELRKTGLQTNMAEVVRLNNLEAFEASVGEQDGSMRIALFAQRELQDLSGQSMSDDAKWFNVMGQPPLRQMFEVALGLPSSFGQIDLDKQLEVFRDKLQAVTGSSELSQFTDPAVLEKFTNRYLARAQINELSSGSDSSSIALMLLQS